MRLAVRVFPALLLVLILGPVRPTNADEGRIAFRPLVLPCRLGLETRWEAFQKKLPPSDNLRRLLEEDVTGQNVVLWDDDRYTSVWAGVDRRLAGESDVVAALRKQGEADARVLLAAARRTGDSGQIMTVFRRYPWQTIVHEALIERGEQELRRGHDNLALRCFQDAISHCADPTLQSRARVGLWLALAQSGPNDALEAAFKEVSPDTLFPWMGGRLSAREIRKRLIAGRDSSPSAPELTALKPLSLHIPPTAGWIAELPTPWAKGSVVAGPALLAWYEGDSVRPAWTHRAPKAPSPDAGAVLAPGPFAPAVEGRRVYSRWGIEPVDFEGARGLKHHLLRHLAAFDRHNGTIIWTTAGKADWEELAAMCDPTWADGRLYVLAAHKAREYSPLWLVCLDADSGKVLWKRELITGHTSLRHDRPGRRRTPRVDNLDVARYGNAVAVVRGAVYCLTNTGVVARCDARDGVIEWLRTYPRDDGEATFLTLLRRQGATPIVTGRLAIFLPRDALGVFAVDCDTGQLKWRDGKDASLRALGVQGDGLLLAGTHTVRVLDVATGKLRWEKRFDETITGRVDCVGSSVYAGTSTRLYRLDAGTGEVKEERVWRELKPFVLRGRTLLGSKASPVP